MHGGKTICLNDLAQIAMSLAKTPVVGLQLFIVEALIGNKFEFNMCLEYFLHVIVCIIDKTLID